MPAAAIGSECLSEDEILRLVSAALADVPTAETHLSRCADCSALLSEAIRADGVRPWGSLEGETVGHYAVHAQIGEGAAGSVYRARDTRLDRWVALKILHTGDQLAADITNEARAAAAITHPAVVAIHDVGVADGLHYVAMELAEGESMRSALADGGLGVLRATELLVDLAQALAAAHAVGVVHRDLKPENLVLGKNGLRVLDFGLAERDGQEPAMVGTAGYIAPEVIRGEAADARSDLFALGAIAFELASGTRAFPGGTRGERIAATLAGPPDLAGLGTLGAIIGRCLAIERGERFHSAADLAWALRAQASDEPAETPSAALVPSRRTLIVAGVSALVAGGLGLAIGRSRRPARSGPASRAADPALRALTHRTGRVYSARLTADGSRAIYGAAWDDEPVAIHVVELSSGVTHALAGGSADVLALSRRGEVAASRGHRFVENQSSRGDLALVPIGGGASRPVAADIQDADFVIGGDAGGIEPADELAVIRRSTDGFSVELPVGKPIITEPGWLTHLRASPDGRFLAFLRHPHTNDDSGALVVHEIATGRSRVLSGEWASIAGLAWDRRGAAVWFTGSRSDADNALFRVDLAGEVTPARARAAGRMRLHDALTGIALVTIDTWRLRAVAASSDGTRADRSLSETSYVSDLSADGETMIVAELGKLEAGPGAYLVPWAGGAPLRLGSGLPLAISPNGERVAAREHEIDRIVVYSRSSADALSMKSPGPVTWGRWIDEEALIALVQGTLWRLGVGAEPVLVAEDAARFALDPRRRRCATLDGDRRLKVIELESGASRILPGDFRGREVCGWLAEPNAIAVRSMSAPIVVERVEPETGRITPHLRADPPPLGLKGVDSFILDSRGERFVYSFGQELSQLFLLDPLA